MASAILSSIPTLANSYLVKFVDTGDRLIDSTLVVLGGTLVATALTFVSTNWVRIYNRFVYYLWGMYADPLNYKHAPFYVASHLLITDNEFSDRLATSRELRYECIFNDESPIYCGTREQFGKILAQFVRERDLLYGNHFNFVPKNNDCIISPHIGGGTGYWICGVAATGDTVYLNSNGEICSTNYAALQEFGDRGGGLYNYVKTQLNAAPPMKSSGLLFVPELDGRVLTLRNTGTLSERKTFDSLFFEQKTELVTLLDKFKKETLYPPHVPIDNKLGILLYGPPGTGKTATITAIANSLGRHVLRINFAALQTREQLDTILNTLDYGQYVIELDELDLILNVLGTNAALPLKRDAVDMSSLILLSEEERKQVLEGLRTKKTASSLDMAYLLQKLDGLESAQNRIIVGTTNHIEKINPALLRPGRFDLKLCLGNCTIQMVSDILAHFYQCDPSTLDTAGLQDRVISPVELINLAIQRPDAATVLQELRSIQTIETETLSS